jgi:hypothetical protein
MNLKVITKAKKCRLQKSKIKTMLITFFDKQAVIHKELVPERQRVTSVFYVQVIGRLLKRTSLVNHNFQLRAVGSCCTTVPLPFRTGTEDISGQTRCYGDKQPTDSPDLAPAYFFLFPTVKTALKGKMFQDVEDIKENVTAELNAVLLEASADCF